MSTNSQNVDQEIRAHMLGQLRTILDELEMASGEIRPDNEARQALCRLQASLETLEAVKSATKQSDFKDFNAINDRIQQASIPEQVDGLAGRVAALEHRLVTGLSAHTRQILEHTAGTWINSQLQLHNGDGDGVKCQEHGRN